MAFKTKDRVLETSTTTGTGTYTLAGAATGFQTFLGGDVSANDYVEYYAEDGTNWEAGLGQVLSGPSRLARTAIYRSSNSNNAVDWGAGTRNLRCGIPAFSGPRKRAVARSSNTILDASNFGDTIVATSTFTQTITAAATLQDGWWIRYRNDGSGVITLDPNGAETVDGSTTLKLYPGESCIIKCDGSNFKTVGLKGAQLKLGTFTRDMTAATGSVAYTGVGFKPRMVLFLAGDASAAGDNASAGFDNGTLAYSLCNVNAIGAGKWLATATASIRLLQGASTEQAFAITSLDDDGFTGTWTKTGSPTGTETIFYLAIR